MKPALLITFGFLIFTYCFTSLSAIRLQSDYAQSYKMSLDTAVDAGVSHITYDTSTDIDDISFGFGIGFEDSNNIPLDRDECLQWFYRIFFRNLNVQDNIESQQVLKESIPMKCVINFSSMSIADENDIWVVDDEPFIITYNSRNYLLTLSEQVQNVESGEWTSIYDIGMTKEIYKKYIIDIISSNINNVLANVKSGYHQINIAINDDNLKLNSVNGSTMIVFSEGIELGIFNPFNIGDELYAISIGGSEVLRIVN